MREVLNDTINMPAEIMSEIKENRLNLFYTYIWKYKLDEKNNIESGVYVYEYKQKKYFIMDTSWNKYWESLKLYLSEYNINEWKEFSKSLLKLL